MCEGPTEQGFVAEVLYHAFLPNLCLSSFLPGKYYTKAGKGRGGDIKFSRVLPDMLRALKNDSECVLTTLFDYYAISTDFPGREGLASSEPSRRARAIEEGVEQEVIAGMGGNFNPSRFRCFLIIHEFEGLLFSDPQSLARCIGRPDLEAQLQKIRDAFETPEHINGNYGTTPARRFADVYLRYNKREQGKKLALAVGLDAMRRECPHFREWLEWLESLC
ncbi:MAG: DUF4276 family protein [Candidatus Sumerlaeia bacterium]|nr:DUF4276 family protein [Candidatus Sumerlaeia bacterium]